MRAGIYPGQEEFARTWALDRQFLPAMPPETRARKCAAWSRAITATLSV
jgi:glycerol kinase